MRFTVPELHIKHDLAHTFVFTDSNFSVKYQKMTAGSILIDIIKHQIMKYQK